MFNNDIIFIKSFNSKKFLAGCAENIVYLYELENDKFKLLHKFKTLKHPAHIAFSSDDNLIAIKNTSGNTVVHKLDNGELLIRHKTSKREGGNLYFIENDRKLISSDWDGNIFTVDIYSGEYNYIKIENGRVGNLFQSQNENQFLFAANDQSEPDVIKFSFYLIDASKGIFVTYLNSFSKQLDLTSYGFNDGKYFFHGSLCDDETIYNKIYSFDIAANELLEFIAIDDLLPKKEHTHSNMQFDSFLAEMVEQTANDSLEENDVEDFFSTLLTTLNNEFQILMLQQIYFLEKCNILFLAYAQMVLVIDVESKKLVNQIKHNFISGIACFEENDLLLIFTCNGVVCYKLSDLIG